MQEELSSENYLTNARTPKDRIQSMSGIDVSHLPGEQEIETGLASSTTVADQTGMDETDHILRIGIRCIHGSAQAYGTV